MNRPFVALGAVGIMVAACSGGAGNLPPCAPPANPIFGMIDPSPGATNVPDNLGTVYFEGFPLGGVNLNAPGQSIPLTLTPVPTPTPTPQGAVPQLYATLSAPLSANTMYTAKETYTVSADNCASQTYSLSVGTFTTQ